MIEKKQGDNPILHFTTKSLPKGYYRINCNKISVTDIGRLQKEDVYFDFEIE